MKSVGSIHPDHLHDRARGLGSGLTPDEWQRFGAHLAACPECAWERAATDDFAREAAGANDVSGSSDNLDFLIDGALAKALGDAPVVHENRPTTPRNARGAGWKTATTAWMVAAAVAAMALPAMYAMIDSPRDEAPDASADWMADASLDAGANGAPSGGS